MVLVALVCGSVGLALRESAPAGSVPGVLVSVDHRDGGDSGTGLVTVQYIDGTGHRATAQVVMTLSGWPSLDAGTPIAVYVRDGRAVDEPDPLVPTVALAVLQGAIVWLVVVLAVHDLGRRRASSASDSRPAKQVSVR